MEYCDGGTLHDLYSEVFLAEEEISYFIRQICEGLTYLHGIGLAHLDIKSENILLNLNGQVKIADFGLVRQADLDTPNLSGMVGTCYWMAPEIIQRKMYNQKADIWALGCVCIELAQGKAPNHDGGALRALFHSATRGAPQIEAITEGKPANWSEEMMDFLQLSLQMDPQARPSAAQLLEVRSSLLLSKNAKRIIITLVP
jgi:serine/threonine protein kinase